MALLNTDLLSAFAQTFRADRYMFQSWLQEGVLGATDFKVTPGGASLQWSVAAGDAWVQGDDATRQGLYHQVNDAAVTGLVAAGHATLPRVDAVILSVKDSSILGVSDTPTLSTLAGTATAGAQITNFAGASYRAGAAAIPNTAFHICDIAVPAAHSGVLTTAMIVDRRKWATRGSAGVQRTAADFTLTGSTATTLSSTDLTHRLEVSTGWVRVRFSGSWSSAAAVYTLFLTVLVDGTGQQERSNSNPAASSLNHAFDIAWDVPVAAGSHTFGVQGRNSVAQTTTFLANATAPLTFSVEEIVAPTRTNS